MPANTLEPGMDAAGPAGARPLCVLPREYGRAGNELGDGFASSGWEALFVAAYAPLLLWGPLVAIVTFDYWRRRRRRK